jgi:peptidoglycan L-alanyl-D-glutamate endopeptidase CwlK
MSAAACSRSLNELEPHVRTLAQALLTNSKLAGLPLTVTCTLRPMTVQAALYAQGRTAPGRIVTNARPGYSFHNFGLAIDVVPDELVMLPGWGDTPSHSAHADALWAKLGLLGKAVGFTWGGEFSHLPDRPHFEWAGGLTLAQLRAGARPSAAPRDSPGLA